LRERIEDLPELVQHFLQRFSRELSKDVHSVAPEAMTLLQRYPWPGNIRELQSALKQALLRATGPVLMPAFLPEKLLGALDATATAETPEVSSQLEAHIRQGLELGSENLYQEAHQQLDRFLLPLVLRSTEGNQLQAARVLGISRQTLRFKIRELGLTITKSVNEKEELGEAD
jgi:DNA-binding NtrC family response regulator